MISFDNLDSLESVKSAWEIVNDLKNEYYNLIDLNDPKTLIHYAIIKDAEEKCYSKMIKLVELESEDE